jgi:serine/threonine protein kinase
LGYRKKNVKVLSFWKKDSSKKFISLLLGKIQFSQKIGYIFEIGERGTLIDILRNSNYLYDWNHAIFTLNCIAKGLAYLHSNEIVHRNLSTWAISVS